MSPPLDIMNVSQVAPAPQISAPTPNATHNNLDQRSAQKQEPKAKPEIHKESIVIDEKMLSLGFSVDHSSHVIKIRITNQNTGELVREFELKGLTQVHHEPRNTKGMMVDDQT